MIDLCVPHGVLARQCRAADVELKRGEHTLTIVFEGAAADVAEPTIGIDYVAVQKTK